MRRLSTTPCAPELMVRRVILPKFPVGTLFHVYDGPDGYFLVKQNVNTLRILKRGDRSYPETPLFLPSYGYRSAAAYFAALPAGTAVRIEVPEGYDAAAVKKVGAAYGEWISEWVLRPSGGSQKTI